METRDRDGKRTITDRVSLTGSSLTISWLLLLKSLAVVLANKLKGI